ncbi:MAG TPA: hypothetical protein VLE89_01300, partial [Chlamydiales bacterium]|nr:hypothetical protein [Chlamydiales bacterium]
VPSHTLGVAEVFNKIPKLPFKLPMHLSLRTVKTLNFIAEKISTIIRVVTIVAVAVFALLGHFYIAGGIMLAIVYEYLDQNLGVIPRKVSLFIEKRMPLISLVGLLIVGSVVTKVMAAAAILTYIPPVNRFIHQQIDHFSRRGVIEPIATTLVEIAEKKRAQKFGRPMDIEQMDNFKEAIHSIPLMKEFDAPLVERRTLTFDEIQKILEAKKEDYEINPAHCTVAVEPLVKIPEDRNFDKLIELWDSLGDKWIDEAHYDFFMTRLTDDKRFIQFLQKRFPEIKRFRYEKDPDKGDVGNGRLYRAAYIPYRNQIEERVTELSAEKGQTKNQFIADWVKEQLKIYVLKLHGKKTIQGPQVLLEQAIENTAKIIPFLTRPQATTVEKEDTLMKLAIEGGDYCTLAQSRASGELLEGFIDSLMDKASDGQPIDPAKEFERQIRLTLQRTRLQMIQGGFEFAFNVLREKEALQDTAEDVHLYQMVTLWLKRGFYPLAKHEENEFGMTDLMLWETAFLPLRAGMMGEYKKRMEKEMSDLSIDRAVEMEDRMTEIALERLMAMEEEETLPILPTARKVEVLGQLTQLAIDHKGESGNQLIVHLRNWINQTSSLDAPRKARFQGLLALATPARIEELMTGIVLRADRKNKVLDHLRDWVAQNPSLNDEQRAQLLQGSLAKANLVDPEFHLKKDRLLLVILGILREKKAPPPVVALAV